MAGNPFTSIARVAVDDMVKKYLKESKFGYFISDDGINDLVDELVGFIETSRSLKSAGDRLLHGQGSSPQGGEPRPMPRRRPASSL